MNTRVLATYHRARRAYGFSPARAWHYALGMHAPAALHISAAQAQH